MATENPPPLARRFARTPLRTEVEMDSPAGRQACELADISLRGAMVVGPRDWATTRGSPCSLMVDLGEPGAWIRMDGIVDRADGRRLGIRCGELDLESVAYLTRLVEPNLGSGALEREVFAMMGHDEPA